MLLFTSSILYNVQFSIKWDSKSSARVREPTTVELVGIGAPGAPLKAARATWSGSRSLRSLQVHARARALVLDVLYRCCDYVPIPICTNHVQSEATGGCHCEWSRSLRSLQGTKMCDACVLFFFKVLYRCCDYVPIPICTNHVESEATDALIDSNSIEALQTPLNIMQVASRSDATHSDDRVHHRPPSRPCHRDLVIARHPDTEGASILKNHKSAQSVLMICEGTRRRAALPGT